MLFILLVCFVMRWVSGFVVYIFVETCLYRCALGLVTLRVCYNAELFVLAYVCFRFGVLGLVYLVFCVLVGICLVLVYFAQRGFLCVLVFGCCW